MGVVLYEYYILSPCRQRNNDEREQRYKQRPIEIKKWSLSEDEKCTDEKSTCGKVGVS